MPGLLTLLTRDVLNLFLGSSLRQPWGIYLGGAPLILADTALSFEYRQQWSVSDYPVERGAFESYDKVQIPYDARFRFAKGGSEAERQAFVASIAAIAGTTTLYNIVTPEAIYISCTISHYDYSRKADNGLGLMQVDVWALEVRETATQQLTSSASNPVNAPQSNGGAVQTAAPTAAQTSSIPVIRDGYPR